MLPITFLGRFGTGNLIFARYSAADCSQPGIFELRRLRCFLQYDGGQGAIGFPVVNTAFDKALLSKVEGLRPNGLFVSLLMKRTTNRMNEQRYCGIDEDKNGGLTHLGRIVIDAWVFGILPETETCQDWSTSRMQNLYEEVHAAWEDYAHLPSRLPPELQLRHRLLYEQRILMAKQSGWNAELGEDD